MIYGIGRNYASHARELGNQVPQGNPIVFFKPHKTLVESGKTIELPKFSTNVHYECELAFKFGPKLEISEIAVANDLTARDKQREAQDSKSPWGLAKGFKQSCGIGNWFAVKELGDLNLSNLELRMLLNDRSVQHGFTKDMIFNCDVLADYLKSHFPVEPGDICLTGTPEGVGPVTSGDKLQAHLLSAGKVISQATWNFA